MDTPRTFVPVFVFEDSPLYKSSELRKEVDLPRIDTAAGQEFLFNWDSTYNAFGGIDEDGIDEDDPVLMRSTKAYREAVSFLRNDLKGPAILFLDLHFNHESGSSSFPLEDTDITEDVVRFANCYEGQTGDVTWARSVINPEKLGFTLAAAAVANPNWEGVITFSSKRVDVKLEKLQQCFSENINIVWRNLGFALAADGAPLEKRARAVHDAIDAFIERRKGPAFWPEYTKGWFQNKNSIPPHDPLPDGMNYESVMLLRKYLNELLPDFIPPQSWFVNDEWKGLYESLKGLIGYHSVSAGLRNGKNLRLSTVPLLLAAQMRWKKENIDWFKSYVWDRRVEKAEIMNHVDSLEAQNAIRAMAYFLEHLGVDKDGNSQVRGASFSPANSTDRQVHLWMDFDLDPLSRAAGNGLLPTIFGAPWGASKGQTVMAYEEMMKHSQVREPPSPSNFSLCIYPITHQNSVITRLDFCQVETG